MLLTKDGHGKQKGYVRLWAFDNHFLTLTDEVAGDWPYVLVTYPKAAKFIVEEEPLIALKNAKQIRAAIISERPIRLHRTSQVLVHEGRWSLIFFWKHKQRRRR